MWETTFEELCRFADGAGLDARSFLQRRSEFDVVFHHVTLPGGRVLEVGCGGGFLSALAARQVKLAVGIDMAAPDDLIHSRGLEAPAALERALGMTNLHFLGCSGESLAFKDDSFDLVLSSYVLEHIPDRPKAIREMKRVVRDDGLIVALVPSWMERVYAPVTYYATMIKGVLRGGFRFLGRKLRARGRERPTPTVVRGSGRPAGMPEEDLRDKFRKFFRVYHPNFPFPRPHGYYRSSSEELRAHRYKQWALMFENEGLMIERAFGTRIAPTCILEMISDGTDRAVQGVFVEILKRRGEQPLVRSLAYSLCFVLRKYPKRT